MFAVFAFLITQIFLYILIRILDKDKTDLYIVYQPIFYSIINISIYIITCCICYFINDIWLAILLSNFLLGCFQDFHTMEVSDLFQIIGLLIVCPLFLITLQPSYSLFSLFPFIFIILTWNMKGTADSLAMIIWGIFYINKFSDPTYVLLGFLFSYIFQLIIQGLRCLIKHYSWTNKPKMAFFPALTLGMTIINFI